MIGFAILGLALAAAAAIFIIPSVSAGVILLRNRPQRLPRSGAGVRGPLPPKLVSIEELDSALRAFSQAWRSAFGVAQAAILEDAFPHLLIEFAEGDVFESRGEQLRGVTLGAKHIKVAARKWGLGRTAFFHELVHWALWVLTGEPDPDHEGDVYPGWTAEHQAIEKELNGRFTVAEEREQE